MNELVKITSAISSCKQNQVTPQIMTICRAITPQFYKNMTDVDLQAEKLGIDLLTAEIEPSILAKMCELAIKNYPLARSNNDKTFFDINYILTFFNKASFIVKGVDYSSNLAINHYTDEELRAMFTNLDEIEL